jgi:hypothetical protein
MKRGVSVLAYIALPATFRALEIRTIKPIEAQPLFGIPLEGELVKNKLTHLRLEQHE